MATALDAPNAVLDQDEQRFVDAIREHGWFRTNVLAEDSQPEFSYTTGLWVSLGRPEIIVFGLNSEVAHTIFWDIFRSLENGTLLPTRSPVEGYSSFPFYFFPVDKARYSEHLGWARWFYGNAEFPCLQMVWPDRAGLFPWQPGFDPAFATFQPDLTEGGWGPLHG